VAQADAETDPYGDGFLGAISPDNRYAPLYVYGIAQGFGVVDLTSGQFTSLPQYQDSQLWWAPDSRSVIYIGTGGQLLTYSFDEQSAIEITPDVNGVLAFAVRS
jgi:hypothetical protein